ncbi:MAG TPA: hypothetical protein V6C57_03470 [Coleofasciculaceae cyanobacterium]
MASTLLQRIHQHQHLRDLRNKLLQLHRVLLDNERITYEQAQGRVSSGELLQLVIDHDQFAWLHRISEQIVQIDELLQADAPILPDDVNQLRQQVRALLTPAAAGSRFEKKYYSALQDHPDAVLAHAEVLALLRV